MSSKNKLERKTVEKNRRIRMKALGFKLASIIPDRHFNQPKVCVYASDFSCLYMNDNVPSLIDFILRVYNATRKKNKLILSRYTSILRVL